MKIPPLSASAIVAAALFCIAALPAGAAPPPACSVVSLEQVRAIAGGPVVIFERSAYETPQSHGGLTGASCVYYPPNGITSGRSGHYATLTFSWGSQTDVVRSKQFAAQRGMRVGAIKHGIFVSALVSSNGAVNWPASKKLLDAALAKI